MGACTECGAERAPGTRFCLQCGARFPDAEDRSRYEPQDTRRSAPPTSVGHGPGWYAGLAGAAAVLVVGLVFGVMAVTGTGPWAETAAVISGDTSTPTVEPPSSTTPSPLTQETPTQTPVVPTVGNDVVVVSSSVAVDPRAPGVVDLLTTYFQSINGRDFATYRSLYTADVQSTMNLDALAAGYRSTQDSGAQLVSLEDQPDRRLAARVDFVSTQDAADGPDGLTCTRWSIALFLQADATGRWWIGRVPPGYHATYQGC